MIRVYFSKAIGLPGIFHFLYQLVNKPEDFMDLWTRHEEYN